MSGGVKHQIWTSKIQVSKFEMVSLYLEILLDDCWGWWRCSSASSRCFSGSSSGSCKSQNATKAASGLRSCRGCCSWSKGQGAFDTKRAAGWGCQSCSASGRSLWHDARWEDSCSCSCSSSRCDMGQQWREGQHCKIICFDYSNKLRNSSWVLP